MSSKKHASISINHIFKTHSILTLTASAYSIFLWQPLIITATSIIIISDGRSNILLACPLDTALERYAQIYFAVDLTLQKYIDWFTTNGFAYKLFKRKWYIGSNYGMLLKYSQWCMKSNLVRYFNHDSLSTNNQYLEIFTSILLDVTGSRNKFTPVRVLYYRNIAKIFLRWLMLLAIHNPSWIWQNNVAVCAWQCIRWCKCVHCGGWFTSTVCHKNPCVCKKKAWISCPL